MTAESRTIEQMIAEWYATGTCSDECRLEIERVARLIAGRYARTRTGQRAHRIIDDAPGQVWEELNKHLSPGHGRGRYDPTRPFQPWCAKVLERSAVDCDREDRGPKKTGLRACVGGDSLSFIADDSRQEHVHSSDRAAAASAMLAEFERLLPRASDRIIIAVQTGYVDGLPDAVVARWCDEADVSVDVDAVRRLVNRVGCLKSLAEILSISYDVVRARSSRAMKDLRGGNFQRAREEFE